jgi:hypothetical protein
MTYWILLAAIGFVLAAAGLLFFYRKTCTGEFRMRCLLPYLVGFLSLLAYALTTALTPIQVTGVFSLLILLPALVSIAFVIHDKTLEKA